MGQHETVGAPEDSGMEQGTDSTLEESGAADLVPYEAKPNGSRCPLLLGGGDAGCGPVGLLQQTVLTWVSGCEWCPLLTELKQPPLFSKTVMRREPTLPEGKVAPGPFGGLGLFFGPLTPSGSR